MPPFSPTCGWGSAVFLLAPPAHWGLAGRRRLRSSSAPRGLPLPWGGFRGFPWGFLSGFLRALWGGFFPWGFPVDHIAWYTLGGSFRQGGRLTGFARKGKRRISSRAACLNARCASPTWTGLCDIPNGCGVFTSCRLSYWAGYLLRAYQFQRATLVFASLVAPNTCAGGLFASGGGFRTSSSGLVCRCMGLCLLAGAAHGFIFTCALRAVLRLVTRFRVLSRVLSVVASSTQLDFTVNTPPPPLSKRIGGGWYRCRCGSFHNWRGRASCRVAAVAAVVLGLSLPITTPNSHALGRLLGASDAGFRSFGFRRFSGCCAASLTPCTCRARVGR